MKYKTLTLISLVMLILLIARLTVQAQDLECNPTQSVCIGPITLSEGVGNPSGGVPGISNCPSVSALTGVEVKTNVYLRQARSSCNELLIDRNWLQWQWRVDCEYATRFSNRPTVDLPIWHGRGWLPKSI